MGVSWSTVRTNLLRYGLAAPQSNPFSPQPPPADGNSIPTQPNPVVDLEQDDLLDPQHEVATPAPIHQYQQGADVERPIVSYTGMLSNITDDELDNQIRQLRQHFRRAGLTHLDGMLTSMGYHIPRERIRQSLARIDPVQRIFQRIRIRRRTYKVAGPNALWHHDGQHGDYFRLSICFCAIIHIAHPTGLIRWGIVIHGFIDGYSRLITGLRASNNNRSLTVLDLFMGAVAVFAIPSRVRGDHGVENLLVAAYMEEVMGQRRGSYIWGR